MRDAIRDASLFKAIEAVIEITSLLSNKSYTGGRGKQYWNQERQKRIKILD